MFNEDEITGRIRRGDIKAFETLFRSSYSSLVRYAMTILKDNDTAEEIIQDLFYRLWKDREHLHITNSLNGYLFRSVFNRSLRYLEHQKVVQKHISDVTYTGAYDTPETPMETIEYAELSDLVAGILEKLPQKCGKIFYMSRFEGLKYREIADKLSVSVKTVEACMGKALKEFRKAVSQL